MIVTVTRPFNSRKYVGGEKEGKVNKLERGRQIMRWYFSASWKTWSLHWIRYSFETRFHKKTSLAVIDRRDVNSTGLFLEIAEVELCGVFSDILDNECKEVMESTFTQVRWYATTNEAKSCKYRTLEVHTSRRSDKHRAASTSGGDGIMVKAALNCRQVQQTDPRHLWNPLPSGISGYAKILRPNSGLCGLAVSLSLYMDDMSVVLPLPLPTSKETGKVYWTACQQTGGFPGAVSTLKYQSAKWKINQ